MTSVTPPLVSLPGRASYMQASRSPIRAAIFESRWFLAVVAAQLVTSAVICGLTARPMLVGVVEACDAILWIVLVFGGMALLGELFRRRLLEPGVPAHVAYGRAWTGLRRDLLTKEYVATVALTFIAASLFLSAFSAAKQAIPALHPFTWDATLSAWDSQLDGGRPLWRRLQPLLGRPDITVSLDWFYHRAWTTLVMAAFAWTAFMRPSPLRRRYLFAFTAAFLVVGNWLALALSSAGPAYFDAVTSGSRDPYAGLLAYLRSVNAQSPLLSVRGEDVLWYAYSHRLEAFGAGISAMPSIHVATATLMALCGFAISRRLGWAMTATAVLVFAASVDLGWHYAVDGYLGAAIAILLWWVAGFVARRGVE
jgi:PAP2 superfamily